MEWDPTFNFAQAAMMLSENTNAYSKNVETLYSAVYSTLDSLSKTDGKGGAASAILKKMRKRVVGFQECDSGFELLDSQFEQPARGIDLKESEGIIMNGSHLIRRVPLLLLPREDSEKGGGAKADNPNKQTTQYKTANCWVSEDSGCLLLDPKFELLQSRDNLARGGRGSFGGRVSLHGPLVAGSVTIPSPPIADVPDSYASIPDEDSFHEVDDVPDLPSPIETPKLPEPNVVSVPETPSALFPPLPGAVKNVLKPVTEEEDILAPVKDPFTEQDPHVVAPVGRNLPSKYGRCVQTLPDLRILAEVAGSLTREFESRGDLFGPVCWADFFGQQLGGESGITRDFCLNFFDAGVRASIRELNVQDKKSRLVVASRNSIASAHQESSSSEDEPQAYPNRESFGPASHRSSLSGGAVPMVTREEKRIHEERQRTALLEQVLETSKREYDEFIRQHLVSIRDTSSEEHENALSNKPNTQALLQQMEKVPEMLYANIRKWQDNLEPLLEEQNARPTFDLDGYLVSILDKLTHLAPLEDETITAFLHDTLGEDDTSPKHAAKSSFESLVKGEPKWNVCRLFLSTLILTNNGNVEIFETGQTDQGETTPRGAIVHSSPEATTPVHSSSFQVKLKNAEKNLKFAVQDNAGVTGDIPIITNQGLPPLEPVGEVPFREPEEHP